MDWIVRMLLLEFACGPYSSYLILQAFDRDTVLLGVGKKGNTLEEGVEPSTLWLTATRSNRLSYSSFLCRRCVKLIII